MGYAKFLEESGIIDPKYIRYYVGWVRQFMFLCNNRTENISEEAIRDYLDGLEADEKIGDWQVRQAADAVLLYVRKYLKLEIRSESGDQAIGELGRGDWGEVADMLRRTLRLKHYSYRTEQTYLAWIRRFKNYTKNIPSGELQASHVQDFLTDLALRQRVSASTQNQAFNALLFLFRNGLGVELGELNSVVRAKRQQRIPVVLSASEVRRLFESMSGSELLIARLLYGCGLRISEAMRLRVKDVDLDTEILTVRSGKGDKDRTTVFPASLRDNFADHLVKVRELHGQDTENGCAEVHMPFALAKKYPRAAGEFAWYWMFPAANVSTDPRTGRIRRHHLSDKGIRQAIKAAAKLAGIDKHVTCHTLRHSFATHLLEAGTSIRTIQELLGHSNVNTTMIYTHVARKNYSDVISPLDRLAG